MNEWAGESSGFEPRHASHHRFEPREVVACSVLVAGSFVSAKRMASSRSSRPSKSQKSLDIPNLVWGRLKLLEGGKMLEPPQNQPKAIIESSRNVNSRASEDPVTQQLQSPIFSITLRWAIPCAFSVPEGMNTVYRNLRTDPMLEIKRCMRVLFRSYSKINRGRM